MEHYVSDFERVILVVDNALDWELYAAVLPLYFPRTETEAKAVRFFLCADEAVSIRTERKMWVWTGFARVAS